MSRVGHVDFEWLGKCVGCLKGKQHRESSTKSQNVRAEAPLALVHSDICGPIRPASIGDKNYVVTFIDDYSRKTWVYLLVAKSDVLFALKSFQSQVANETGFHLKVLRSDSGGE